LTALAAVIAATLTFLPLQQPTDLPAPPAPPPAAEAEQTAPAPDYAAVTRLVLLDQAAMAGDTAAAEQLVRLFWHPDDDKAVQIARRESGLRCNARNPRSSASGLFQTLQLHAPRAQRMGLSWGQVQSSCLANIAVARALYAEQGWRPWRL